MVRKNLLSLLSGPGRDGVSLRGFKAYWRAGGQSSGLKNHLHQDITWPLLGDAAASSQSGYIN